MAKDTKKHMILTTDIFQYTYQDYLEWCDECNIPKDERFGEDEDGGHLFNEWRHEQAEQDIDTNLENLRYSEYANRSFIITGTLGLWDGHHKICHNKIEIGLVDTIKKCVSSSDIWDYDVFINDDEDYITVHAKHHDGTNVFEIHMLTPNGAVAYDEAYAKWNYQDGDEPELKPEYFEKIDFNKIF
jgi:hypothetical protein